jgi:hypothetical protein
MRSFPSRSSMPPSYPPGRHSCPCPSRRAVPGISRRRPMRSPSVSVGVAEGMIGVDGAGRARRIVSPARTSGSEQDGRVKFFPPHAHRTAFDEGRRHYKAALILDVPWEGYLDQRVWTPAAGPATLCRRIYTSCYRRGGGRMLTCEKQQVALYSGRLVEL